MTTENSNGKRDAIIDEAQRIVEDANHSARGHFQASQIWDKRNMWLGIPATILAAATGVSAVAEYTSLAGVMAILVAILSGLLTFLNPSERSSRHLKSGNAYNALRNDARIFYQIKCRESVTVDELEKRLDDLNTRRNNLNTDSPQIPRLAYVRGKDGIEKGETDYRVDT